MSWDEFIDSAESATAAGNLDEAAHFFKKALDVATRRHGKTDDKVLMTTRRLSDCYIANKKGYKAKPYLESILDILTAKHGMGNQHLEDPLKKLFVIELEEGNRAGAEKVGRKLLHIQETHTQENLAIGETAHRLARYYESVNNFDSAEGHYKKALMNKAKALGNLHSDTMEILEQYSALLRLMHRDEEARHLKDCIEAVALGLWDQKKDPSS